MLTGKIISWLSIGLGLMVIGGLGYIIYVEFVVIPSLLRAKVGDGALLIHVFSVALLIVAAAVLGGWLRARDIFQTHEKLTTTITSPLIGAIENLVSGRWRVESAAVTHTTGKLMDMSFKLGAAANEPNPEEVLKQLMESNLPPPRQVGGQSRDVVDDMDKYLDELEARKARLSG